MLYWSVLFLLSVACAVCVQRQYNQLKQIPISAEFYSFQKKYLIGYIFACASDWIQGPYIYKLYQFYGFTKAEIGFLFVLGFGSAGVFGTIVGGLADKFGRKRTVLMFCVLYSISCMLTHVKAYEALFLGRVLSGICTSILFSAFEAWMNHEHKFAGYLDEWMVQTVSYMTLGSSLAGIGCSVVASAVSKYGGYTAPFDVALLLLVITFGVVKYSWNENYGDQQIAVGGNFAVGWVSLTSNMKIWLLGLIQTFFEGSMYCFVFSWTPILEETTFENDIPHGIVFACFMVAMMLGSFAYQHFAKSGMKTEKLLTFVSVVASFCLLLPGISSNHSMLFLGFVLYELCVGVYFSGMAYLRSQYLPNEVRATIMNIYRVPMNLFVILILINISSISHLKMSVILFGGLLASAGCYRYLDTLSNTNSYESQKIESA